jgi:hypothetical protein
MNNFTFEKVTNLYLLNVEFSDNDAYFSEDLEFVELGINNCKNISETCVRELYGKHEKYRDVYNDVGNYFKFGDAKDWDLGKKGLYGKRKTHRDEYYKKYIK